MAHFHLKSGEPSIDPQKHSSLTHQNSNKKGYFFGKHHIIIMIMIMIMIKSLYIYLWSKLNFEVENFF